MNEDWKALLYHYAKANNEALISGDARAWPFVLNDHVLEGEQSSLEATRKDWQRRNVRPLKSTTHAKHWLVSENEEARQITVKLYLTRTIVYEQYGERYEEDRGLLQQVVLCYTEDGWRLASVKPLTAEQQHLDLHTFATGYEQALDHTMARDEPPPPGPLLNTYVLYGAEPVGAHVSSRKIPYDRRRVKQYADRYWNSANPSFLAFDVDCTNYVSQCLLAGGAPMNYTGRREAGWWYQGRKKNREMWSYSWSVSNSLLHYLSTSRSGLQAETVDSPYYLELGDVIIYDWNGDGIYQHSTIVTGFDAAGEPLVNAHTTNSRARLWSYRDSPAWTERTRYRFFHIADFF